MVSQFRPKVKDDILQTVCLPSTTVTYSASKAIEFGEITQNRLLRRSRSFKVTDIGTSREPVCDFLLVINTITDILYRSVSKLMQIIVQIMDDKMVTLRFSAREWLEATYTVHLRLIGKRVVDFVLLLFKLYSLGVTAEALLANMD